MTGKLPWIFRFLLSGTDCDDLTRQELRDELRTLIPGLVDVNILPVNRALQIDIEMAALSHYDWEAYEPYLIDHILGPTARRFSGRAGGEPEITPLRARSRR
ncbi:MAG: hypothetical protein AAGG11_07200 [Pseudomonadota bacterium]